MRKLLIVDNLCYQRFRNISLSFEKSKFYSIVGPNKSGKTTLFRIMSGLIKTDNYITCDDITLNNKTRYDFVKKIGVVQRVNSKSFKHNNVYNEMAYPLYNLNYSKSNIDERIITISNLFGMQHILDKRINELNNFEKQVLLLMISLLHDPKVVLIDDVLEKISEVEREIIITIIKKLVNNGLCVIYFTHLLNTCLASDELILLNNSQVVKKMMIKEIIDNDKLLYDNNIEIPFIIDLNIKLKMYNILTKKYDSIKQMVDDIWQ